MRILINNIRGLIAEGEITAPKAGSGMSELTELAGSYLLVKDGKVAGYGSSEDTPDEEVDLIIDGSDRYVLPSFVDSHTHIVYTGSREAEFVQKIQGLSYQQIARKGGGILHSARKLRDTAEDDLYEQALIRIWEVIGTGTGAIEIKSGYGLSVESELKILRVIRKLKTSVPAKIRSTFLGAHAVPDGFSKSKYLDLIINRMIPEIASEGLADYCDVFCEEGFFSPEEAIRVLEKGMEMGMKAKVHANQLALSGGVKVGVDMKAISVDHLETIGDEEVHCLSRSDTIGTLLPGAAFFLGMNYAPARMLIEAGIPVAIASDYNPGSAPSGNMSLIVSLACIGMRMTPAEAIHAATINGACAMEVDQTHGSIAVGKEANLIITRPMPSLAFLPYSFGSQLIESVILQGKVIDRPRV